MKLLCLFLKNDAWNTGQLYVKKKEISIFSSTYININLKQLKDLNMTRNHKF